jgi:hypothetical protein
MGSTVEEILSILSQVEQITDEKDFQRVLFQNLKNFFVNSTTSNKLITNCKNLKEFKEALLIYYKHSDACSDLGYLKNSVLAILAFVAKDFPTLKNLNVFNFVSPPLVYKVVCKGVPYEKTIKVFTLVNESLDIFKKYKVPIQEIKNHQFSTKEQQSSIYLQMKEGTKINLTDMTTIREIILTMFTVQESSDSDNNKVTRECIDVVVD